MRNRMFLTLVLSLCMADFGAFAAPATRGNARGTAAANNAAVTTQSAPVAARAASRQKVANTPTVQTSNATSGNVAARAGKKQTVVSNNASAPKPMAARAGATQKVINTGQKVATATANTTVPQECQDAFYGCMDSFCMLDNASGGRCQCNDRVVELDKVLEDILKLDEQTYIMATEGVERIQMGEAEEQIMARAKAAADKVTVEEKEQENQKKVRTLDLSAWNNNIFSEEEDVFGSIENSADLVDTFADKKGDELYKAAAKLCVKQIPTQCNAHDQMMQLVYAQKIKSDCSAYENSLKQQKNASQQKLQTAQKALRDAALDEYKNQNKYGTSGECAVAFAQCMQNDAGCGSDYTGCVTLAAKENVANNKGGTKATQTTIKGIVAGADITLAASTMESLLAKKEICQKVVKQCVAANSRDDVWTLFLRNAAPALKSAEEMAESNLRMQCIPTIAECYKTACKSTINPNDEQGSYDMCLSNPDTYKSLCKVQLEPCLAATGGSYDEPTKSSLWDSLLAALNAMKVDACTKQVTDCLTADTACGKDYFGCIGLDTETIADLCPEDKLTACKTRKYNGESYIDDKTVRAYVNEIAKGISLNIDNSMLVTCQKAADDAMIKVCGSADDCAKFALDKNIGATSLSYQVCQVISGTDDSGNPTLTVNEAACKDSAAQITKAEMGLDTLTANDKQAIGNYYHGDKSWGFGFVVFGAAVGGGESASQTKINYINMAQYKLKPGETQLYSPMIKGTVNWGTEIVTKVSEDDNGLEKVVFGCASESCDDNIKNIVASLNNSMDRMIKSIESDTKVQYCMTGRQVRSTSGNYITKKNGGKGTARFPNLTDSMRQIIANNVYNTAINNYNEKLSQLEAKRDADYLAISSKYEEVMAEKNQEKQLQQRLATNCNALNKDNSEWNYKETIQAVYNEASKTCTKTTRTQKCKTTIRSYNPGKRTCKVWEDAKEKTEQIRM